MIQNFIHKFTGDAAVCPAKQKDTVLSILVYLDHSMSAWSWYLTDKFCINTILPAGFQKDFAAIPDHSGMIDWNSRFCKSDRLVQTFAAAKNLPILRGLCLSRNQNAFYLIYIIDVQRTKI